MNLYIYPFSILNRHNFFFCSQMLLLPLPLYTKHHRRIKFRSVIEQTHSRFGKLLRKILPCNNIYKYNNLYCGGASSIVVWWMAITHTQKWTISIIIVLHRWKLSQLSLADICVLCAWPSKWIPNLMFDAHSKCHKFFVNDKLKFQISNGKIVFRFQMHYHGVARLLSIRSPFDVQFLNIFLSFKTANNHPLFCFNACRCCHYLIQLLCRIYNAYNYFV